MRKIDTVIKAGALLTALGIGCSVLDNLTQNRVAREYQQVSQKAGEGGFDNYWVNNGPTLIRGVHDCGICILAFPTETWVSHYGFKFSDPRKANFDTSYIGEMIRSANENPTEAYLIGGDERYIDRLKRELASQFVSSRVLYCDNVRADAPYDEGNEKNILVSPNERKIIIEKNGRYKKIKY